MKKTLQFSFLLLLVSVFAFAQSDKNWKRTNKQDMSSAIGLKKRSFPESSAYFDLNLESFRQVLLSAPKEARSSNVIISVPNINGEMEQYKIWEYSNFAPELQAQFPNIRAYAGVGIKDKTASIRISLDPNGIQTMVLRADRKTEFIESYTNDGKGYALFNSARSSDDMPFVCSTKEEQALVDEIKDANRSPLSNNQSFKTFRLALSCTGEYAAFYGGTVAGALAGMNATMTRVNGVYEIDLAIKLELIAQQASIIYLNAATDPYSDAGEAGSGDGLGADGAWISELQNNLTATIGNGAYDIGHLFGASGGGGNAGCIGCVCNSGKGSGFTSPGNGAPQGDAFDIDYVAHEMGHQLGGNHTFSFSVEGSGVNVEPGSGSSIMAYAGIVTGYNVQDNSDDYFTYRSILQIQTNLATKACPVSVPLSNTPPTVSAGPDYTIPKGTPFILTGTGSDVQTNSSLKYTWEQNDSAVSAGSEAATLANSIASPTKVTGPNFRSVAPTSTPVRYFPALSSVIANTLTTRYESVSTVARTLNFTLTARDYGVGGGQTNTDATVVTVSSSIGPFDVTSQNTAGISYTQGSTQTVTWAVGGTTALPGSSTVDILLSTDGGLTYPITLKSATANDGTESIVIPNVAAPFCRIMVKPTGHIYYDINPVPFAIGYTVTVEKTCTPYTSNTARPITGTNVGWFVLGQVTVPDNQNVVITDTDFSVNITHPRINDLRIGLVKPNSTVVDLILYDKSCSALIQSNMITTFDDSGVALSCAGIAGSNSYKPVNALEAFNGMNSAGLWRVAISDTTTPNNGTLNSFTLNFCTTTTTIVLNNQDFGLANFKIYPNPNNGNFTVQFDSNSGNDIKVAVHDIRGRQVFDKSYSNNGLFSENLSLNNIQSGIYLVTVQDGDKKEVKKIVIE